MNIALLTAAGKGTRMQSEIPKQFLHIRNKPVILYTMAAFQKHPQVDAIMVVSLDSWRDMIWSYARQYGIGKLKWIVEGGSTGQESIRNGLLALEKECSTEDIVIVHDGNRPMISNEVISDSLAVCRAHGSAVAAIPCIEAIYQSKDGEASNITLDRNELFRTQTPHSYPLGKLLWAHEQAKLRHIENTTATCTLMTELGETVYFSRGSEKNLKLTTREDVEIFQALLRKDMDDELL
ncbi:MAG: 2-C-methyl-D-erythritol 4-phosphate cytidylyltransferase [Selenomonadaceae bacterium]|nr:2-C-methyl-D-erythritol 4-phosphate cytidylyltransferase [Selenomonadaceae bacterium]